MAVYLTVEKYLLSMIPVSFTPQTLMSVSHLCFVVYFFDIQSKCPLILHLFNKFSWGRATSMHAEKAISYGQIELCCIMFLLCLVTFVVSAM